MKLVVNSGCSITHTLIHTFDEKQMVSHQQTEGNCVTKELIMKNIINDIDNYYIMKSSFTIILTI